MDIKYAKAMGRAIKLLASSKKTEGGYVAMVAPFLLPREHPLYSVNGVFNAIFVRGNVLGDAMFYGSGAGNSPMASAVVSDVVEMAKHLNVHIPVEWSSKRVELVDYKSLKNRYFGVRRHRKQMWRRRLAAWNILLQRASWVSAVFLRSR